MATYFRADGWVKSVLGPAVSGAQIYVCNQPATDLVDIPPAPLSTLYSDPLGNTPLPQPVITDGFGHYDFYTAAGTYTVVVVNNGLIQQIYPDQSIAESGGITSLNTLVGDVTIQGGTGISVAVVGSSIILISQTQGVVSLNTLVGNLTIIPGTGIAVSNVGSSQIEITNTEPGTTYTGGTGISVTGAVISNSGVLSMNSLTGALNITAGSGITVTPSGTSIQISASSSGVSSLNSLTGFLNITAGTDITITPSGSSIQVTYSGGFPSGQRLLFGTTTTGTITYSPSFTTAPRLVLGNYTGSVNILSNSSTGASLDLSSGGQQIDWMAIGS